MKPDISKLLNAIGRTLIGAGVLILLFVVYQLWGTGLQEARSQNDLEDEFRAALERAATFEVTTTTTTTTTSPPDASTPTTTAPTTTTTPPEELVELANPERGEAIALIEIPRIGLEKVVVQGVGVGDLRRGPGHYPDSPLPGQAGNAAIAGHRTTYGAPFNNLDKLAVGDEIVVTTVLGTATYRVREDPFVVPPTQVEVLDDVGDNRLTLTSCHPKFSARQRLIVTADLVGEPFPDLPDAPSKVQVGATLSGDIDPRTGQEVTPPPAEATDPPETAPEGSTTAADDDPTSGSGAEATAPPETAPEGSTTAADDDPTFGSGEASTDPDGTTAGEAAQGDSEADLDEGLGGDASAILPALLWGAATALVGLAAWWVGRWWKRRSGHRLRPLIVYVAVSPLFLTLLYICFSNVDRVLPAY